MTTSGRVLIAIITAITIKLINVVIVVVVETGFFIIFDFADRIGIVVIVMKLYGLYLLVAGNNDIVISCFLVL